MKYLLILAGQLQIGDGVMSHVFVNNGIVKEGNPLMAPFIQDGNYLLIKVVGVVLSIPLLWIIYKRFPRLAMGTATSLAVFYSAVLCWNFLVFFSMT
jgi:hypothetical protein